MSTHSLRAPIMILILCLPVWHCCTAPPAEESAKADAECGPAEFPVLQGDYLGQQPPGTEPVLFAPGIVSTGLYERDVVLTPDGNELYFGLMARNQVALCVSRRVDGKWTAPVIAPFSSDPTVFDLEPHITPDGSKFMMLSTRPAAGAEPAPGWENQDIWIMDRTADGWGEPYNPGPPINTEAGEYFPSTTRSGTLYFTRTVTENGARHSTINRCRLKDGEYQPAEELPPEVNAGDMQYNAFIDPDEQFLIFGAAGLEDAIGMGDYYISFRDEDDTWTGPINMGTTFNTPGNRVVSASLSPDGKYLFFASNRGTEGDDSASGRSYREFQQSHGKPLNGNSDVYWVEAAIIETFRPE